MKVHYALENLRTLERTPDVELRPITILVGRNSAGKSTFLRSFALLRQSIEVRSSAPVLWFGDYVDFGDFKAAVRFGKLESEVTFHFRLEGLDTRDVDDEPYYDVYYYYPRRTRRHYEQVSLSISLGSQLNRTVRRRVVLEVPSSKFRAEAIFSKDGQSCEAYIVNGENIADFLRGYGISFPVSNIFSKPILTTVHRTENKTILRNHGVMPVVGQALSQIIRPHVDKRITDENIGIETRKILECPTLDKSHLDDLALSAGTKSFEKLYFNWMQGHGGSVFARVKLFNAFYQSVVAIGRSGKALSGFFRNTTYLGPARARSERYYRSQELEVSEISPDGQNLAMFLGSLPPSDAQRFSKWVQTQFGFEVGVSRSEGHISIQLTQGDFAVNVADTGYGVSQLLPVLAQIWWATSYSHLRTRTSITSELRPITMEQPELHLHPAHQAKLADVLCNSISSPTGRNRQKPIFVIETHSEALINRLGELVEEGELSKDDVQIMVFSGEEGALSPEERVTTATFNRDGALTSWPFGFFNY